MMRILFLSRWFPWPPDNGSKIRVYNLIRQLSRHHEITLLSFVEGDEGYERPAEEMECCQEVETVPLPRYRPASVRGVAGFLSLTPRYLFDTYSRAMRDMVEKRVQTGRFDLLLASQLGTAAYVPSDRRIPSLLEELELTLFRDAYATSRTLPKKLRYSLTWLKLTRFLARQLRRYSACTVVSSKEKDLLVPVAPATCMIDVIPNGVDLDHYSYGQATPAPDSLVFSGALTYEANYDAMRYFLAEIYPLVRSRVPGVRLQITGRSSGIDLRALALDSSVVITGYLPDVRPVVAGSWVCVVPLRLGGGTRLKILEAMALGTPVVTTTKGAEGLEVVPGEDIIIADHPAAFAAATADLLRDERLREKLARNARRLVKEKYGWEAIGQKLNDLATEVVASHRGF